MKRRFEILKWQRHNRVLTHMASEKSQITINLALCVQSTCSLTFFESSHDQLLMDPVPTHFFAEIKVIWCVGLYLIYTVVKSLMMIPVFTTAGENFSVLEATTTINRNTHTSTATSL
jgi:hypothetical protein